ncbi:MAG TPA: hypothetical protein VGW12_18960 [Pyrinomonadaceae bacterium]|nr:hypothetical protein [Pyrinomonadaceae bacterium]
MKTSALALALLANGMAVNAQDARSERRPADVERREVEVFVRSQQGETVVPAPRPFPEVIGRGGDTMVFVSTELSFDGKLVKGSPYSAQAVTETVQTLSDGNRIVRRNSANVYRDSEGRTRREQALPLIGHYAAANGDRPQTFFITDPVAGVSYVLDPNKKTARKMNFHFRVLKPTTESNSQLKGSATATAESKARVSVNGYTFSTPVHPPADGSPSVFFYSNGTTGSEPKKEDLGEQTINGVRAKGTRTTMTIPAGAIGNEQPINVISERWYSDELQAVVQTRHSDPRHGETTYNLTNINRTEPARSLFEVPGDYTITETPNIQNRMRRRQAAPPAPQDL